MAISPSTHQWYLFARYQQCPPPLHPVIFLQHWEVSYSELAQLADCSLSTVEHWFSSGPSHREPSARICRQLAIVHRLWMYADRISPEVIQLWCNSSN